MNDFRDMGCCTSRWGDEPVDSDSLGYSLLSTDNNSTTFSMQSIDQSLTQPPPDRDEEANKIQHLFESLLLQLEHACSWTKNYDVKDPAITEQLKVKLKDLLENASDVTSKLSQSGRSFEADKIVTGILNLRDNLGGNLFDLANIYAFAREKIEFGKYHITVGQYFRPVMLSDDEDNVLKLFFFRVTEAETGEVIYRYYLEHCSFIDDEYFALGLGKDQSHTQIDIYGSSCPSYWLVRSDVLRDLKTREKAPVDEDEFPESE